MGDDDLVQSDYEDTNVLGTDSDQEIPLTPKKKRGKRKKSNSGNKRAKRNRVKRKFKVTYACKCDVCWNQNNTLLN